MLTERDSSFCGRGKKKGRKIKNNLALDIIKAETCAKISRAKYNLTPLKAILAFTDLFIHSVN